MSACTHLTPEYWIWEEVVIGLFGETEFQLVKHGGEYTYEDIDIGRFRCTQCREVKYYTGLWRDFYEKGIPCSGSDRVAR